MTKVDFEQAFNNRTPQQIVADATYQRGYRNGFTNEQFLARQILKMLEELNELVNYLDEFEDEWVVGGITALGEMARESFDRIQHWQQQEIGIITIAKNNPDLLREEIADMQVVLFNMAQVASEITGQKFDVIQAAVDKARADIERGVR